MQFGDNMLEMQLRYKMKDTPEYRMKDILEYRMKNIQEYRIKNTPEGEMKALVEEEKIKNMQLEDDMKGILRNVSH